MKTSLALAAGVLLAFTSVAYAKTKTEIISLDGHCDVITIHISKSLIAGADDPACSAQFGGGLIGKVKGFGNAIVAGVQSPAAPGVQFVLQISYPLITGGTWNLYDTTDGVTLSQIETGTYSVSGAAAHGAKGAAPLIGVKFNRAGN
jgi:hypothetical protein